MVDKSKGFTDLILEAKRLPKHLKQSLEFGDYYQSYILRKLYLETLLEKLKDMEKVREELKDRLDVEYTNEELKFVQTWIKEKLRELKICYQIRSGKKFQEKMTNPMVSLVSQSGKTTGGMDEYEKRIEEEEGE